MQTRKYNPAPHRPEPVTLITLVSFLCGFYVFLPGIAYGENQPDPAKPVEAGIGGNIKLEKKYRTKAESLFEWHAHLLWESRYVTEGRDNLSGKSLLSASSEFALDKITIIPWIANSPGADYSEFDLNIIYGIEAVDNFFVYAGYTHIQVRDAGIHSNDNEISFDLTYTGLQRFTFAASTYHSFDTDGLFTELSARYNLLSGKKIDFSLQGVLGVNGEYIANGHNGLNHFQLRANAAYHALKQMEIYAYAGYNKAIHRDISRYIDDASLDDFFWSGIGMAYRF